MAYLQYLLQFCVHDYPIITKKYTPISLLLGKNYKVVIGFIYRMFELLLNIFLILLQNINEDNSISLKEAHGGGLPTAPTAFRLPKERMATMLLTSTGGKSGTSLSYPTLRLVTGSPSSLKQAFKLTSNSSSHPEGCGSRLGQRQDPYLLMSTDTTIPTLLELTQQDYEVNAPANNSLLQGADLLMALDQSNEAALLDGK